MNSKLCFAVLTLITLSACSLFDSTSDKVAKILTQGSVKTDQLEGFLPMGGMWMKEEEKKKALERVEKALSKKNLEGIGKKIVESKLSEEEIESYYTYLKSPTSEKLQESAMQMAEGDAQVKIVAYQKTLQEKPESAARVKVLTEYDQVTGATEKAIKMMMEMLRANGKRAFSDIAKKVGAKGTPDTKKIDEAANSVQPFMETQIRESTRVGLSYTLRDLTDDEIRKQIEFLKTPVGQKSVDIGIELNKAIMKAAEQAASGATGSS